MYRQIDAEKRGVIKKLMTLFCSKFCVLNVKTSSYDTGPDNRVLCCVRSQVFGERRVTEAASRRQY